MAKNGFIKKSYRKVKAAASEKYVEYKKEKAQERAASKMIRAKARAAGYKEKETQAIRYAKESERYRTTRKLKAMKAPRAAGGTAGSIIGYLAGPQTRKKGLDVGGMNKMLGVGGGFKGYQTAAMGKPKKRKNKSKELSRMMGL
jgi:hypothetical protein